MSSDISGTIEAVNGQTVKKSYGNVFDSCSCLPWSYSCGINT